MCEPGPEQTRLTQPKKLSSEELQIKYLCFLFNQNAYFKSMQAVTDSFKDLLSVCQLEVTWKKSCVLGNFHGQEPDKMYLNLNLRASDCV